MWLANHLTDNRFSGEKLPTLENGVQYWGNAVKFPLARYKSCPDRSQIYREQEEHWVDTMLHNADIAKW